jgi:hypothetical protein
MFKSILLIFPLILIIEYLDLSVWLAGEALTVWRGQVSSFTSALPKDSRVLSAAPYAYRINATGSIEQVELSAWLAVDSLTQKLLESVW